MAKRLVVCCDGTWNTPDQGGEEPSPTNVSRLVLQVVDDPGQRVHYVPGVGTSPGQRLRGGIFGLGLSENVLDGYRFLVRHYEPGDELFLFGFSRGAFTARSLAGLVRNSGILRPEFADQVDAAWALYRDRGARAHPRGTGAEIFRKTRSHDHVDIHVLGVWDTVGALGIPGRGFNAINERWRFHDTTLSSSVSAAFHAMALDERRDAYVPTLWTARSEGAAWEEPARETRCDTCRAGREVQQVWFSGAHSDVGGGYAEAELADITFRWMTQRAAAHGLVLEGAGPRIDATASAEARDRGALLVPLASGLVHDSVTWWSRLPPPSDRTLTPSGAVAVGVADSVAHRGPDAPDRETVRRATRIAREGDDAAAGVSRIEVDHLTDETAGPLRCDVHAERLSTTTPVVLTAGRTYGVSVAGRWSDGGRPTDAAGYDSDSWALRLGERLRRAPRERWFQLMGEVDGQVFPLRDGVKFVAPASGRLLCWPNDVRLMYGNNDGHVSLTIEPLPDDA